MVVSSIRWPRLPSPIDSGGMPTTIPSTAVVVYDPDLVDSEHVALAGFPAAIGASPKTPTPGIFGSSWPSAISATWGYSRSAEAI